MSNYPPNEVVDILLILGKCHRNYRHINPHISIRQAERQISRATYRLQSIRYHP